MLSTIFVFVVVVAIDDETVSDVLLLFRRNGKKLGLLLLNKDSENEYVKCNPLQYHDEAEDEEKEKREDVNEKCEREPMLMKACD